MLAPGPPTLAAGHWVGLLLGVAAAMTIMMTMMMMMMMVMMMMMLPVVVWLDGGEGLVGGVRLYGPARRALAAQHGGVVILHRLNKMLFLIHIFCAKLLVSFEFFLQIRFWVI